MSQDLSLEIYFVLGNKVRGRIKRKHVRYFDLRRMNETQYHAACQVLQDALSEAGKNLLALGYSMEYKGEKVEE